MQFTLRRLLATVAVIAGALALLLLLTAEYRRRGAIRSELQAMGAHDVYFTENNSMVACFHVPVTTPSIAKYRGELIALDFKGAHVTDESLENVSGLEEVNVIMFPSSDIRDDQVRLLKRFRKIRGLWLSHTGLSDACIDALIDVPGLEWVKVNDSQFTASGIDRLCKARPNLIVHNPWSRPDEGSREP